MRCKPLTAAWACPSPHWFTLDRLCYTTLPSKANFYPKIRVTQARVDFSTTKDGVKINYSQTIPSTLLKTIAPPKATSCSPFQQTNTKLRNKFGRDQIETDPRNHEGGKKKKIPRVPNTINPHPSHSLNILILQRLHEHVGRLHAARSRNLLSDSNLR